MSVIGHVDSAGSPYQSGRAQSSAPSSLHYAASYKWKTPYRKQSQ